MNSLPLRRRLGASAAALAAYLGVSILYLRPIVERFASHLPFSPVDPVLNLYLLKWGAHQIRLGLPDFWNAPFFYPAREVIALSDHMLGPAAFAAVFTAMGSDGPGFVAAYNALFLGSFVLCGWAAFEVMRRGGIGGLPAFFGGAVFAFSSFRWDQVSHLQMLLAMWIPPTLWTFDRLLERPGWRRAGAFLLFYALHVTGGTYLAYMIHVPLLVLLLNRLPSLVKQGGWRRDLRVLAPAGLAAAALTVALFLPYMGRGEALRRSQWEIRTWGASPLSYVTPSASNLYAGEWSEPWRRPENALFAGFLPTALILAAGSRGLLRLARREPAGLARLTPWERGLLAAGIASFLLTFPAVFQPLASALPGLGAMRVPARFYPFVSFAVAWFAARELERWRGRLAASRGRRWLAAGALLFLLVELAPRPWFWFPVPAEEDYPPVYGWLAGREEVDAILELPIRDDASEALAMVFGTRHWKPLVNGYSGHFPPTYTWLRQNCCWPMPEGEALERLREWGVTHVLVHRHELRRWEKRGLERWARRTGARRVYAAGGDRVYRISSGAPTGTPAAGASPRAGGRPGRGQTAGPAEPRPGGGSGSRSSAPAPGRSG